MLIIFGAPGAGKTEQGKLLSQKYGWRWLSYQSILTGLHDKDVAYALNHGLFVDDKKATAAIDKIFDSLSPNTILDGFPSNYRELQWLINNHKLDKISGAIILRVPRGELWQRLVKRKRVDDTRAAIERRQDLYERNITGMIKALPMNGVKIREVDGGNSPDDVLLRIEEVLGNWGLIQKKDFAKITDGSTFTTFKSSLSNNLSSQN